MTAKVRISVISIQARADWLMVDNLTVRIWTTLAWVTTDAVEASQFCTALIITPASSRLEWFDRSACGIASSDIAIRAFANHGSYWGRVNDAANGRGSAGGERSARVLTFVIDTS